MIRCFHGFYLSIREDAWRRPSDEAVQDRTGTCRAGEGTQREPSREPAAMHAASSSLPSGPCSLEKEYGEPSGQGTFRDEEDPSRSARPRQAGRIDRFFAPRGDVLAVRGAPGEASLQNKAFLDEVKALDPPDGGLISCVDIRAKGAEARLVARRRQPSRPPRDARREATTASVARARRGRIGRPIRAERVSHGAGAKLRREQTRSASARPALQRGSHVARGARGAGELYGAGCAGGRRSSMSSGALVGASIAAVRDYIVQPVPPEVTG
jgi:hypothetical protein